MKPLTPNTPHVIVMVGIPGAGKTTFAKRFAKTFEAPYINPRDITELTGIDTHAAAKVTTLLFNELLKTNRTLVFEGVTHAHTQRLALENMVTKAGYKVLTVWVQTDPNESKHRATKKRKGSLALSDAEFDAAYRQFQNPVVSEKAVVISGKHTYATQLKIVLKRLATTARADVPPVKDQTRIVSGRNIIVR
jgi:predicted kinase